jgi:hypothetical protein
MMPLIRRFWSDMPAEKILKSLNTFQAFTFKVVKAGWLEQSFIK